MQYIHRAVEDLVINTDKTFKCTLITGARQTGKTELIHHLFPDRHYIAIDDLFVEEQANENPGMFMMLHPAPAIYDEVQRAPALFRHIKLACDSEDQKGQFCLTGSQPLELMNFASESLAGRVGIIELSPLSQREIAGTAFNRHFLPTIEYIQERGKTLIPPANIWQAIHRGGYPALQDPNMDWAQYFSSYVKTYLERDVRKLTAVQNLHDFRRFLTAVAARTGQIVNYTNIADEIGKDQNTIKSWMSILESTGIIYLLEPFSHSLLKKAIKTPKIYFRDTGLAAYLTRWLTPETLAAGAMSGAFFETFVVSEILKSFSNTGIDYRYCVSYYRGRDKIKVKKNGERVETESEIDLIIEENGCLYPIEIKQNSSVSADEAAAFTILDTLNDKPRGTGAIVCLCASPGLVRENIFAIPAWYI